MELINRTVDKVTQQVFTFDLGGGLVIHYKEWLNEKGKVIDSQIVGRDGMPMEDWLEPSQIEEIQARVDEICAQEP